MEQAEVPPPQRAVCDPCRNEAAVASIWSTLWNGFSAGKHWLALLMQSIQNARTTPLAHSLATYRQMVNWDEAFIRCMAIHPTSEHQALVTSEDIVYLFVNWADPPAELQAPEQVDLYCVAYRPCTNRELAVGCAAGIYIWRNVSHQLWGKRLLSHKQHIHVTSVQWNQPGTTLVSVALGSRQIVVWETDSAQAIRTLSASISFLLYSPDFQLLFGAGSVAGADVCYVERRCWQLEHILAERAIQTAAWTACSTYLLFVQKDDTHLYSITRYADLGVFLKPQLFWTFELVADLHEIFVLGEQKHHGQAQAIAVDPLNIYLAVIYKRQPFVLLCKLSLLKHTKLRIIPWEYIHCDNEEARGQCAYATCMCFGHAKQNGRRRSLTIGWNTGYNQVEWLKTDKYKRCT